MSVIIGASSVTRMSGPIPRSARDDARPLGMTRDRFGMTPHAAYSYRNRPAYSRRSFDTLGATTAWQYIRVGFRWKYCW